jgi:hypothetical protein
MRAIDKTRMAALLLACASATLPAWAQDSGTAEALFKKALQELDAGHLDAACPMLAESFRIDSRPGTLFTLAECEAQADKLASAIAHYSDYLQLFSRMPPDQRLRQQGRDAIATEQIAKLAPLVPQLVLVLPANAPEGTIVRRGSVVLQRPSWGIALPVDPGEHVITTQAPGGAVRAMKLTIARGETRRVELEVAPAPGPAPAGTTEPRTQQTSIRSRTDEPRRPRESSSRRTWAYVLGGIGLEGLAVGAVTGVMVLDKKKVIDRECTGNVCTQDGKSAADSAHTLGTVSTVTFGLGLAAIAGAAVLWVTDKAPERGASSTRLQPMVATDRGGAWLGLRGGF